MFKRPKKGDGPEEGSSPECPIELKDASASDFTTLLKVLYASHFPKTPVPEAPLVVPAFRLANLLVFSDLCEYLLPLAEKNLDDVDKIAFAREFNIKEWLVPALDCTGLEHYSYGYNTCAKCNISATGNYLHCFRSDNPNEIDISDDESGTGSSEPLERHPEFFFDNTLVAIQSKVGKTLFNVHKYQLAKSKVFSERFKMRELEGDEPEEGSSPERPIKLTGVSTSDFTALLRVLYASHFSSNQPAPEAPLIVPAFRLANIFNFSELRIFLFPLAEKNLNDVDKITFAKEFDIKEWLAPAHAWGRKRANNIAHA
ncbi:unnamed protein product [Rhizoctonia solani]|uniref:BTB domain-containing protein n=1 Tax=Rhizoctonia solani TaxID=456999 RepID=A0A8H2WW51_9AGAM|nr:unnamed protein product [Rhizoctonia solani]